MSSMALHCDNPTTVNTAVLDGVRWDHPTTVVLSVRAGREVMNVRLDPDDVGALVVDGLVPHRELAPYTTTAISDLSEEALEDRFEGLWTDEWPLGAKLAGCAEGTPVLGAAGYAVADGSTVLHFGRFHDVYSDGDFQPGRIIAEGEDWRRTHDVVLSPGQREDLINALVEMTSTGKALKECDNASVGVLIERDGAYLMFDRNTPPVGTAPVAGHVFDDHTSYESAACAEVAEELGLTVTGLTQVTGGWRSNACRRQPGPRGTGHLWVVYRATVTGELAPSARETRNVRWLTLDRLQGLAITTAAYAQGIITDAEFEARPGIEPVWVMWLVDAGVVTVTADDLAAIERLAEASPTTA